MQWWSRALGVGVEVAEVVAMCGNADGDEAGHDDGREEHFGMAAIGGLRAETSESAAMALDDRNQCQ